MEILEVALVSENYCRTFEYKEETTRRGDWRVTTENRVCQHRCGAECAPDCAPKCALASD